MQWKETRVTYEHRMDRYARYSFLKQHLEVRARVCVCVCVCVCAALVSLFI